MDEPMFTAGVFLVGIGVWAGLIFLLIGERALMLQRYSGIGAAVSVMLLVAGIVLVVYGLLKQGGSPSPPS